MNSAECDKCKEDFVPLSTLDSTCQSCQLKATSRLVWDGRRFYRVEK